MSKPDSPLAIDLIESPHRSIRTHKIDGIAIHCMAGDATARSCGAWFQVPTVYASSNYGIDSDGNICQYVLEKDRSWCTSSREVDDRSITIEVANRPARDPWRITDAALSSLVALCVDICRRNNIPRLIWSNSKTDRVEHRNGCNMACHRDYAQKSCPGQYIYDLEPWIATEVNKRLEETEDMTQVQFNQMFATAMAEYTKELTDNDAHQYSEEARDWAIQCGLIKGIGANPQTGEQQYAWEQNVTREQLVEILFRMTQHPPDAT